MKLFQVLIKKQANFPFISIISFIFCLFLFLRFPYIDIFISNIFFYETNFPFNGKDNLLIKIIDRLIEYGGTATWITIVAHYIIKEVKKNGLFGFSHKQYKLLYISLVGLIGSVGIVHFMKAYFMRCRPNTLQIFNGKEIFTKAWMINDYAYNFSACKSFISGHSAIGFLIFSIAFIFSKHSPERKFYIILGILVGSLFGIIRIIQGQHFASDVIFSGYVIFFTSIIIAKIMKPDLYK